MRLYDTLNIYIMASATMTGERTAAIITACLNTI
jgi:hypothetical protein